MYFFRNRYYSLNHFVMVISEIILIFLITFFSNIIKFYDNVLLISPEYSVSKISCMALFYLPTMYYFDLFSTDTYRPDGRMVRRLLKSITISTILLFCFFFLLPQLSVGRQPLAYNIVLLPVLLIAWRVFFTEVISVTFPGVRVLIVGSDDMAQKVASEVLRWYGHGMDLIGFIDDKPLELKSAARVSVDRRVTAPEARRNPIRRREDLKIVGGFGDIVHLVTSESIQKIIVAVDDRRIKLPMHALLECKLKGVNIMEGETFLERGTGKVPVSQLKPSWLVFSEGFKSLRSKKRLKRFCDIVLSLIGLVFASPICLIAMALIKLESKGPAIYKQVRVGEGGNEYEMYKFRSMVQDAETKSGPVWAQTGDTRVTRVGAFIRRVRIDEIPQLFNALKGEMSLVGPRPERNFFVKELRKKIPYYDLRLIVKPGITGWAQINYKYGATEEDAIEKLQLDLFYIKYMSFFLDLLIILKTIKAVIGRKGSV